MRIHLRSLSRYALALILLLAGGTVAMLGLGFSGSGRAEEVRYFRIGAASASGSYYPVAEVLSAIISQPPGAVSCESDGPCGVPGLVAITQVSEGSVANLNAVNSGEIESGLAQADLIDWAARGVGMFAGSPRMRGVRAIANLYQESFHLIALRDAGIESVVDLKGRRVSIDRIGSGTHAEALLLLNAYGLGVEDIIMVQETPGRAAEMMLAGQIDAMLFIGGYPVKPVSELALSGKAMMVPFTGAPVAKLMEENRFLAAELIPANAYTPSFGDVQSLAVGAQWIVSASIDEETVYRITRALWDTHNRAALRKGHPLGARIRPEMAMQNNAVPLHPGALRYYREAGLLPGTAPDKRQLTVPDTAVSP